MSVEIICDPIQPKPIPPAPIADIKRVTEFLLRQAATAVATTDICVDECTDAETLALLDSFPGFLVDDEAHEEFGRVDGWEQKHAMKMATRCKKKCGRCGDECHVSHPDVPCCPPCFCSGYRLPPAFGVDSSIDDKLTTKGGPIELSVAFRKHRVWTLGLRPWSCMLRGQLCNIICIADYREMLSVTNVWQYQSFRLLLWNLEQNGFEDSAIMDVFHRVHERAWDDVEDGTRSYKNMEEMSPAYQVALIVTWGGRVKVAGQWKVGDQEVVMVGDHQLGAAKSYPVMCYGQPHGTPPVEVTIREGEVCARDTLMLVPKDLASQFVMHNDCGVGSDEKACNVLMQDDCEEMARQLLKHHDRAWVARFTCIK